jgi:hypothetical protein
MNKACGSGSASDKHGIYRPIHAADPHSREGARLKETSRSLTPNLEDVTLLYWVKGQVSLHKRIAIMALDIRFGDSAGIHRREVWSELRR